MPVVWSPEKEATLIAGIFQICDVKVTAKHHEQLARMIGPECTAKAVSHRIVKFRSQAPAFNGGSKDKANGGSKDKTNSASGDKTKSGATNKKKSTPKSASDKKRSKFVDEEDDDDYGTLDFNESLSKKPKKEEPHSSDDETRFVFKVDDD